VIVSWPMEGAVRHSGAADESGPARGLARTPAFSSVGLTVSRLLRAVEDSRIETSYQSGRLQQLLQELTNSTVDEELDGQIDDASFAIAELFLRALSPGDLPHEADVDPDGEATFDWGEPGNRFAVSVSSDWQLAYAGLFMGEIVKGTELFLGDQIPSNVLDGIRRCQG